MPEFHYETVEIGKALKDHPADEPLQLKIRGENGESRWLNVTPAQARAIADILR